MAGNGNSGRNAKPAVLHLIENKSKLSAAELKTLANGARPVVAPVALPECPAVLTQAARTEWNRIIKDLATMGVVSRIDRGQLAVYCQAWADWVMARTKLKEVSKGNGYIDVTPNGFKQMSAWLQIANRAEERMRLSGALFGLNPSARASLQIQAPQAELFPNEQKEAADRFFGPQ